MTRALLLEDDPVAKIVALKLLPAAGYEVSHVADVYRRRLRREG